MSSIKWNFNRNIGSFATVYILVKSSYSDLMKFLTLKNSDRAVGECHST